MLSRHRHPQAVHGLVLKGRWHYLEHDWVATEGAYVFEPPGETHTLVVPDDVEEMITYFQVNGVMYYVDPWGKHLGLRGRLHQDRHVPRAFRPRRARGRTMSTSSSAEPRMGIRPDRLLQRPPGPGHRRHLRASALP